MAFGFLVCWAFSPVVGGRVLACGDVVFAVRKAVRLEGDRWGVW